MKKYKTYKNLDLAAIREAADLDFAHYTYLKGMCSCCYGPKNFPSKYWKNGKVPHKEAYSAWSFDEKREFHAEFSNPLDKPHDNEFEYLLFKNADNGSGIINNEDMVIEKDYIEWGFPSEKLELVCSMLQKQLGDDYKVIRPKDFSECIQIRRELTRDDLKSMSFREVAQAWERVMEEDCRKKHDKEFVLIDDFLDELLVLQLKIAKINGIIDMWGELRSWSYNRCKRYLEEHEE